MRIGADGCFLFVFCTAFAIINTTREAVLLNHKNNSGGHVLAVRIVAAVCAVLVAASAFLFLFLGH